MIETKLIKVVATCTVNNKNKLMSITARGITSHQELSIFDFIKKFAYQRNILTLVLYKRPLSGYVLKYNKDTVILTYTFIEFSKDELGFYAKDLTSAELERDKNNLFRNVNG